MSEEEEQAILEVEDLSWSDFDKEWLISFSGFRKENLGDVEDDLAEVSGSETVETLSDLFTLALFSFSNFFTSILSEFTSVFNLATFSVRFRFSGECCSFPSLSL